MPGPRRRLADGVKVASRFGAMFQYQGTSTRTPLRLSIATLGGSQPDLRSSVNGKLNSGAQRIGTPRKRSTAPCAMPSLLLKSILTRSLVSSQSGSPLPSAGQLLYVAFVATVRWLSMKSMRSALPPAAARPK